METALIALIFSFSNIICFLIGAKVCTGRSINEGRKPQSVVEKIKTHREVKESQKEEKQRQKDLQTMLHNIDVYDGTGAGQQDVGK